MKYNQALPNITHRLNTFEDDIPITRKRNLSLNFSPNTDIQQDNSTKKYTINKHQSQYSPKKHKTFSKQGTIYKNINFMKKCQNNLEVYLSLQKKLIKNQQTFKNLLKKSSIKKGQKIQPQVSLLNIKISEGSRKNKIKFLTNDKNNRIKTQYKASKQKDVTQHQQFQNSDNFFQTQKKYKQLSFQQISESQYELSHEFTNKILQQKIKLITTKIKQNITTKQVNETINGW